MKKFIYINVLTCLLFALGCTSSDKGSPITIKFTHVTAPATPKGQGAERLRLLVEERLQGRVNIEVFPSGQLMNDDDSLEALAFGEVQMIAVSLSKFDRLTNRFQLFDLPFLFSDLDDVERFQHSPTGQELLQELEEKGFHGLGFWHNGMKQFSARKPIRTPTDAAGLKFRIMESDVLQEQILQIGGIPQKMAFGEVYQALQTGAIDAQENTWSNIYSQKFYEVQDYVVQTNHGYLGYFVAVNKSFWDGQPDDIRMELESIVLEVTDFVNSTSRDINQKSKEDIIASGRSDIITLSDEELLVWREAMTPVWDQFRDKIGSDIVNAALGN